MPEQRYSIGKAADKTGLNVHTLRYYEKEGLLPFVERTQSGLRSFKDDDFVWINLIKCLKSTGLPIKEIKVFIDWCMEGDSTLDQRLAMFKKQKETINEQIAELNGYLKTIEHKIGYYEKAIETKSESMNGNTANREV